MKAKIKQKRIYAFIVIFALLLSIFPFNFEHIVSKNAIAQNREEILTGNFRWTPTDNPGEFRYVTYIINGSLTIEAGTHLRLFSSEIMVNGNLFIEGEENNPVVIEGSESDSSRNYTFSAGNGSEVEINYAVFRGGGGYSNSCMTQAPGILSTALAEEECILGALNVGGDKAVIRNSTFEHNFLAINFGSSSDDSHLEKNIFSNNEEAALNNVLYDKLNARDNCWMRPSGPTHLENPTGLGEKIIGNVDFSNWQKCGTDHRPVLIIPGIGGSWNWDKMFDDWGISPWSFAPADHTYDSLVKSFEFKGYQRGKDLQIVFYDWRKDNHESAENFLAPIVDDLKKTSFDEKYDIVAHSMGGIVTMDYLQNHGNELIDKVVFLGTPMGGSAKAYPVWEGGVIPNDWNILKWYLWSLKYKNIEIGKDRFDLIHEHIPSVKQLLPIYDYVVPRGASDLVWYDKMYEYNQYLDDLFWNTSGFFEDNTIIVEGSDIPTSKMIDVEDYAGEDDDKIWKDGLPIHNPLLKDESQGDGTVVNLASAFDFVPTDPEQSLFPGARMEELSGVTHTQLPTVAIPKIHDFLFAAEELPHGDYPLPSENKLIFAFASPVDVRIVAPDEKYITEIDNTIGEYAHYYSDGQADGAKIVEVENPVPGEYRIELTGNGNGEYHILASKQNGENYGESKTQGQIAIGQNLNYSVDTVSEEFKILPEQSADTAPPVITITSPDDQGTYINDQYALPVEYSIADENPVSEDVELDGEDFSEDMIDLSFQKLGGHSLKISAADEAGNQSEQTAAFRISTDAGAIRKNFKHYFDLKLVKNKVAKEYFDIRFKNLEKLFNLLKQAQNSKLKPLPKKIAVEALKKIIKADVNLLVSQINRKSPSWIDPKAANLLIEGLNFIRPK